MKLGVERRESQAHGVMSNLAQPPLTAPRASEGPSAEHQAALLELFARHMSPVSAKVIVRNAVGKAQRKPEAASDEFARQLELSIKMLVPPHARVEVRAEVLALLGRRAGHASTGSAGGVGRGSSGTVGRESGRGSGSGSRSASRSPVAGVERGAAPPMPSTPSPVVPYPGVSPDTTVVLIRSEADMNATRVFAREICKLVGMQGYAAQKVVTAVSELARNIARYAGEGRICFRIDANAGSIVVVAEDHGPGIEALEVILAGGYRSRTGLGRGLIGVKKLATQFAIETSPSGTRVEIAFRY